MGIVARETAQFFAARPEAAAGAHGDVVLEKIGAIRVTERQFENRENFVRPRAGTKIQNVPAGLQHARSASLVADDADFLGQARGPLGGVRDSARLGLRGVRGPGPVAVLAADGKFGERRIIKEAFSAPDGASTPAVTPGAGGGDGAAETKVGRFVAG